jgi:hypothetical protein
MLVFDDRVSDAQPRQILDLMLLRLREVAAQSAGIVRHGALAEQLVVAGEIAQGLADAAFQASGLESHTAAERTAMTLLCQIARAVRESWDSGFATFTPPSEETASDLRRQALPERIRVKQAEGFAFYTLYPESYLEAARLAEVDGPIQVLGIRSIGVPLAAIVADALRAPVPVTVRPVPAGDTRVVRASGDFTGELLRARDGSFAVVDEGPGWSGSSFGAVGDALEDEGVALSRIHCFCSHLGELPDRACARHRARWPNVKRHAVDPIELIVHRPRRPEHRLASWVADVIRPVEGPLQDLSKGAWRFLGRSWEGGIPPSWGVLERRKFLAEAAGQRWLLKFAGLGACSERKLARARTLQRAGFVPEVAGLRHGFLVERWVDAVTPERAALVDMAGRYLGFRARHLPAGSAAGATLRRLWEMARFNTQAALGTEWEGALEPWRRGLDRLEGRVRRVETDNRLHLWEWLGTRDGQVLKADAVDHAEDWSLIGCQDIAWDVAGAIIELDLDPTERERLIAMVEHGAGRELDRDLLRLLTPCYLAFQLGSCALAADIVERPDDAARLRRQASTYTERLRRVLTNVEA